MSTYSAAELENIKLLMLRHETAILAADKAAETGDFDEAHDSLERANQIVDELDRICPDGPPPELTAVAHQVRLSEASQEEGGTC